ncbi:unnamed protein product [Orchesella dallaii]|uniref:Transmembrane protein n=1 Tax=Orchesella dallaii TaxID=48710 RepID=A0ABP1QDM1_9HEXA
MTCRAIFDAVVELAKSMLVLTAATLYRCFIFMVYLSASIGPSALIENVYEYCSGLGPLPPLMETVLCMLFMSLWAEFSVGSEKRFFGNILEQYKQKYPVTMNFGRFTVHFVLYTFAYFQLYVQFEATHSFQSSHQSREHGARTKGFYGFQSSFLDFDEAPPINSGPTKSDKEMEEEAIKWQDFHIGLFKLALAYLVFVTSKNLHRAILLSITDLPYNAFYAFNNCMIRVGFAVINLVVNTLYFIPTLALCYSIRSYKYMGMSTYFQLSFVAGLSGMVSSLFEMNKPWPQRRGQMPFLYLENNLMSKNIIAHGHLIFILICFYRPFSHTKIPSYLFDSGNPDVIYFCLSVAFTVLHITKYGTHAVLSMAQDSSFHRIEVVGDDDVVDINSGDFNNNDSASSSNTNNLVYNSCTAPLDPTGERTEPNQLNTINNNNNVNTENDSSTNAPPPPVDESRVEPKEFTGNSLFSLTNKTDLLRALKVIEQAVLIQSVPSPSSPIITEIMEVSSTTDVNRNATLVVVDIEALNPIENENRKSNEVQISSVSQDIETGPAIMQVTSEQLD